MYIHGTYIYSHTHTRRMSIVYPRTRRRHAHTAHGLVVATFAEASGSRPLRRFTLHAAESARDSGEIWRDIERYREI